MKQTNQTQRTTFDTGAYENDLAMIFLETLFKKQMMSTQAYTTAKSRVKGDDAYGYPKDVGGTAKIAV